MAYTTLKNNWKSYSEHCLHPLTQAIQRDEVERGYYAGVATLLGLIKHSIDHKTSSEDLAKQLMAWQQECLDYIENH